MTDYFQKPYASMGGQLSVVFAAGRIEVAWEPTAPEAPAGPEHADDLFTVGDSHQRIYGRPLVLSQCGINVRGRSRKLRINYRTTEETRAWATAVLAGMPFDDLDGGSDGSSDTRSLLHGEPPLIRQFRDPAEEQQFLVELVSSFKDNGQSLGSTCVTAISNEAVKTLAERFEAAGISTRVITAEEADDPSETALRLATMHRVKGLEFDHMLIPGLSAGVLPNRRVLSDCPDQVSREAFEQRERSLLHVAATRARKRLVVTYCGEPSPFLQPS